MRTIIADSETTGTGQDAEIIEAAWLILPGTPEEFIALAKPLELPFYHQRFQPSCDIELGAMATHNIIPSDLDGMAASSLFEFEEDVEFLIGHNIDFDHRIFGEPDVKRICTLALSRWLFPEMDNHKQTTMIYFIGSTIGNLGWARNMVQNAHSALADVKCCAILLKFLLLEIKKRDLCVDTWEQVLLLSNDARIPTVMGFGKHKGEPICDVPSSYVKWYRGQAETDQYVLEAFKRAGK